MRVIPKHLRNVGESFGLEYPYICRALYLVWDRHTGKIVHIEHSGNPNGDEIRGRKKCRELNSLGDEYDAEVNALHDMEP